MLVYYRKTRLRNPTCWIVSTKIYFQVQVTSFLFNFYRFTNQEVRGYIFRFREPFFVSQLDKRYLSKDACYKISWFLSGVTLKQHICKDALLVSVQSSHGFLLLVKFSRVPFLAVKNQTFSSFTRLQVQVCYLVTREWWAVRKQKGYQKCLLNKKQRHVKCFQYFECANLQASLKISLELCCREC